MGKANYAVKAGVVWSTPERLRVEVLTTRRYTNLGLRLPLRLPWNGFAVELVQEIGRRTTAITEGARETAFLSQHLSMALQQGNAVAFQNTMSTEWVAVAAVNTFL